MGGMRKAREGRVGCIPAVSVDEGKHECQVGVSRAVKLTKILLVDKFCPKSALETISDQLVLC